LGGSAGIGNIATDPDFAAPFSADFQLNADSPCINAATGTSAPVTDKNGIPRPWGGGWDMGAYEYYLPVVHTVTDLSGSASVKADKTLRLSGTVSPWSPPGTVTIAITRLSGGKWKSEGSARVSVSQGGFSYDFKSKDKGSWRFVATYSEHVAGPTTYTSSKSGTTSVKVD
jgi:hypothetical protein